jgi:hypothetical protein
MFSCFRPPGPKFSCFKPPVPRDGPKFSCFKPPVPRDGPYRVIGVDYYHLDILSSRGKRYAVRIDGFVPRARPDTEDLDDLMIAVRVRDAIARWVFPGAFQKTGSAYSTKCIRMTLNLTPIVTTVEWVSATEPYSARFVGANGVTLTQALVSAGYGSAA